MAWPETPVQAQSAEHRDTQEDIPLQLGSYGLQFYRPTAGSLNE